MPQHENAHGYQSANPFFWNHPSLPQVSALMKTFSIGQRPSGIAEMAKEHLGAGGKRFRALMTLQAAEMLGVPQRSAVYWAAAVELIHNATLVHDDIQDGDAARRGHPTVWKKHGVGQAINVGDLLLMVPYQILSCADFAPTQLRQLLGAFSHRTVETVRGQSLEMTLKDNLNFDRDTYIQALRGKTGQLLALTVEGPLILSEVEPLRASQIASGFEALGVAFQIYDDIWDLYADKGRGQVGNDLREGKISALLIAHLEKCPKDRLIVTETLKKPFEEVTVEDVAFWEQRFEASGARVACEAWAQEFVEMAVATVPDQPLRSLVEDVALALGLKNLKERQ